jgi:hypothetical protein
VTENERIASLEVSFRYMTNQLEDTHKKVEEMHALLLQARGAKWVIIGSAAIIGFLTSILAQIPIKRLFG